MGLFWPRGFSGSIYQDDLADVYLRGGYRHQKDDGQDQAVVLWEEYHVQMSNQFQSNSNPPRRSRSIGEEYPVLLFPGVPGHEARLSAADTQQPESSSPTFAFGADLNWN